MWKKFFVTPTTTTTQDDARQKKWSLYVAYAKAGRQHNNKNIQSEKIIRKRVIHKLLEVLYGIIKLGAVEKKSIKLSLNNKYMQAMLLEENNFYNTDFNS